MPCGEGIIRAAGPGRLKDFCSCNLSFSTRTQPGESQNGSSLWQQGEGEPKREKGHRKRDTTPPPSQSSESVSGAR